MFQQDGKEARESQRPPGWRLLSDEVIIINVITQKYEFLSENEKDAWAWQEQHECFPLKLSLLWPIHALCHFSCPCAMGHLLENQCSWVCWPRCVHDNLTIFAQSLPAFSLPEPSSSTTCKRAFPSPTCALGCASPLPVLRIQLCLCPPRECPFFCWQPLHRCSVLCCLSSLSHSSLFPADETHVALAEKLKYSSSSIQNPPWCTCLTVGVWLKVILTMSLTLLFSLKKKRIARLYV